MDFHSWWCRCNHNRTFGVRPRSPERSHCLHHQQKIHRTSLYYLPIPHLFEMSRSSPRCIPNWYFLQMYQWRLLGCTRLDFQRTAWDSGEKGITIGDTAVQLKCKKHSCHLIICSVWVNVFYCRARKPKVARAAPIIQSTRDQDGDNHIQEQAGACLHRDPKQTAFLSIEGSYYVGRFDSRRGT